VADRRVVQCHVLYLGEINSSQELAWGKSIELNCSKTYLQHRSRSSWYLDLLAEQLDRSALRFWHGA
jgi:hypothetical protein